MSGFAPFDTWTDEFKHLYRGIVRNNVDPLQAGRVQVEIWPMFFDINPTDLPWAISASNIFEGSGNGTGTFAVPDIGSLVWCFFEEGNYYQPVYFAEAPDLVHGIPPEALINYPNRKVWKTTSGISMIFDNTAITWSINNPAGMTYIVDTTGERLCQSGFLQPYAGSTAPSGWLLCYGQSVSTQTYPQLFAVIGYTYGGSGETFNVPDMRGRICIGLDNMGGIDAMNLYESQNSMTDERLTLGGIVGETAHTQTIPELVPHDHIFATLGNPGASGPNRFYAIGSDQVTENTGGGLSFNVVQGGVMINWIIKL